MGEGEPSGRETWGEARVRREGTSREIKLIGGEAGDPVLIGQGDSGTGMPIGDGKASGKGS